MASWHAVMDACRALPLEFKMNPPFATHKNTKTIVTQLRGSEPGVQKTYVLSTPPCPHENIPAQHLVFSL